MRDLPSGLEQQGPEFWADGLGKVQQGPLAVLILAAYGSVGVETVPHEHGNSLARFFSGPAEEQVDAHWCLGFGVHCVWVRSMFQERLNERQRGTNFANCRVEGGGPNLRVDKVYGFQMLANCADFFRRCILDRFVEALLQGFVRDALETIRFGQIRNCSLAAFPRGFLLRRLTRGARAPRVESWQASALEQELQYLMNG